MARRIRFNVRGALLATTWIAAGVAILTTRGLSPPNGQTLGALREVILWFVLICAPFAAVGSLFGRSVPGILLGTLVVFLAW